MSLLIDNRWPLSSIKTRRPAQYKAFVSVYDASVRLLSVSQAVQQGYCNGVSSSATLDRTAMGQTPKQKYRPLSLGRSFDQDLFEEDLEGGSLY